MRELKWILRAWGLRIRMYFRWKYESLRRRAMMQGYRTCAMMANAVRGKEAAQRYAYQAAVYETERIHKLRKKGIERMRQILADCPLRDED